ncbi:hypothetical protein ABE444_01060 [Brevundimonas pondensis]|jgi:hypothetical protein|uniref:Lipoprotein n=1 Tax=Brevundimonas pondensis TaxID=2774189 RepID=A0ABX7SIB8_9CAUL|nr:hypothetical protein [Brevundimonas pondensis]QTC86886.1 hypothetical protein IFE19_12165 [Brevundimonas pondensis]
MIKKILGIAAILSLGACASPYVATPYDRAAHNVQSITMMDDALPEKAIAYEVASVGSNFGLIGALVDAGIQASRQDAVNDALIGAKFDAEDKLETRLVSALAGHGYKVAPLTDQPRAKRDLLETYPAAAEGVDAYLDVSVTHYGYMSSGAGQPFRPSVGAEVRLVKVSDRSTLMENTIVYNPLTPIEGVITLPPNPQYVFSNRAELLENPDRLAAGIEDALNQVADTAARLLQ